MATEPKTWINSIADFRLRSMIEKQPNSGNRDGLVRESFVYLEQRIRESTGLPSHAFGKELIDAAFHPDTGRLQPVSPVGGERAGLHHLLLGLFLFYRNPIAHRPVYYSEQSSRQILQLIDHALDLVRESAEQVFDLAAFVSPHEGQILERRDYRLDIDGDGEEDVVVLAALGPVMDDGEMKPHLAPIVLKKEANGYKRIPADKIAGISMYGPIVAELQKVTDEQRLDLVVIWTWGETQTLYVIFRYDNGHYTLVKRDNAPDLIEPYSGPSKNAFTVHNHYKGLSIADIDGDGFAELIQTLRFDKSELTKMGYAEGSGKVTGQLAVCRVWKWDPQKQMLIQTEERLVVEKQLTAFQ